MPKNIETHEISYSIDNAKAFKNSKFKLASQTPDMLITRHVYKLQIFNKYTKMFDVLKTKWASVGNLRCIKVNRKKSNWRLKNQKCPDEQFCNKIMTYEYRDSGWDQSAAIYRISLRNKFYEKTNQIKIKKQKFWNENNAMKLTKQRK